MKFSSKTEELDYLLKGSTLNSFGTIEDCDQFTFFSIICIESIEYDKEQKKNLIDASFFLNCIAKQRVCAINLIQEFKTKK